MNQTHSQLFYVREYLIVLFIDYECSLSIGYWMLKHHEVQLIILCDDNFKFSRSDANHLKFICLIQFSNCQFRFINEHFNETGVSNGFASVHGALQRHASQIEYQNIQYKILPANAFEASSNVFPTFSQIR